MQHEASLDVEQRRAVEAMERAIVVLAGPGSGKTRVLSFRARSLLSHDNNSNALLLTFTNKAASEMKARAIAATPSMSKRIEAGTFHYFAMSVLRSHGTHVGIDPEFDVLDDSEQKQLAEVVSQRGNCQNHAKDWSTQRLRLKLPTAEVAKFGALFEEAKREEGVVNFDDLIVYTVKLFKQKPEIAKAYATRYKHILIDEFQDTNTAQFEMVRALAEYALTISVFADDDQAIFGFAGAESKNITRFCDDLQAEVYPLTTNYRCCQEIVQRANMLILANRSKGRQMKAKKIGGQVIARVFNSISQEAEAICREIKGRIDSGTPAHDISILVRSAYRAKEIQSSVVQYGIPCSNWLAAIYNSNEAQQVRICLAIVRPVLTKRICHNICKFLGIEDIPDNATINTEEFLQKHKTLQGVEHLMTIRRLAENNAQVSEIIQEVGDCIEVVTSEAIGDSLVAEVAAFEAHDPEYSIDHLLSDLALGGKGGAPTEGGGVKLATIHRTKGLQWPHVYMIGLEADQLPFYRIETDEELREERRLCFVGTCRAEDSLTITRIESYRGHPKSPSLFLRELGLKEVRT